MGASRSGMLLTRRDEWDGICAFHRGDAIQYKEAIKRPSPAIRGLHLTAILTREVSFARLTLWTLSKFGGN